MISEYWAVLLTCYSHVFRLTAPGISLERLRHTPVSEPSVGLHLREPEGNSSSRVTSAPLPDNSVTTDPDALIRVFCGNFAGMFS